MTVSPDITLGQGAGYTGRGGLRGSVLGLAGIDRQAGGGRGKGRESTDDLISVR